MRYYHGTDYESGISILRHGFHSQNRIWNCSNPNHTYLVRDNGDENDNDDISFAINAAQMAAAHKNSNNTNLIIFAFDFDDEADEYIMPDMSCPNMDSYNCYQIESEDLNKLIKSNNIKVQIRFVEMGYIPYLRAFYLASPCEDYYTIDYDDLLYDVVMRIKRMSMRTDTCWFYDMISECIPSNFEELEVFNLSQHEPQKEAC